MTEQEKEAQEQTQAYYCYSTDGVEFEGRFESREEAQAEGNDIAWHNEYEFVETGRCVPAGETLRPWSKWCGEGVYENLNEALYDEMGEGVRGDGPLKLAEDKQLALGKLITNYLIEHATMTRFAVTDTQEHNVTDPSTQTNI